MPQSAAAATKLCAAPAREEGASDRAIAASTAVSSPGCPRPVCPHSSPRACDGTSAAPNSPASPHDAALRSASSSAMYSRKSLNSLSFTPIACTSPWSEDQHSNASSPSAHVKAAGRGRAEYAGVRRGRGGGLVKLAREGGLTLLAGGGREN